MNKILVLYHANCADGFGAAWAAWKTLGNAADYKPVQYGQEIPDIGRYTTIYLLDFSYPRSTLERWRVEDSDTIQAYERNVYVIDHHKSAEEMLRGFPGAEFDMTHSGAYLAWRRFHPNEKVPTLIKYIEDRDLWKFELPHSQEVSAALWSYPMEFNIWSELHERLECMNYQYEFEDFWSEGEAILRYMNQQVQMICDQAFIKEWPIGIGLKRCVFGIPVVNATNMWSEVCEELLNRYPDAPFVGAYYETKEGLRKWSLRSRGEFDVSEIAKLYGGGGHKNAAGFEEKLS